jgi:hypothetical protein
VGPTTGIAQNGIQVSRGASAQVLANTVSGNQYTGGGAASSAGVLLYGGCGDPLVKYANHPTCTTAQPYVTYRIDTTGSLNPLVIFNS